MREIKKPFHLGGKNNENRQGHQAGDAIKDLDNNSRLDAWTSKPVLFDRTTTFQ
jgi:hypothetical protein